MTISNRYNGTRWVKMTRRISYTVNYELIVSFLWWCQQSDCLSAGISQLPLLLKPILCDPQPYYYQIVICMFSNFRSFGYFFSSFFVSSITQGNVGGKIPKALTFCFESNFRQRSDIFLFQNNCYSHCLNIYFLICVLVYLIFFINILPYCRDYLKISKVLVVFQAIGTYGLP